MMAVLFMLLVAAAPDSYDAHLEEGLKLESLGQFSDAIRSYVRAIDRDPTKPLPKERIISIFTEFRSQGKSTVELENELPSNLKDQLSRLGVVRNTEQEKAFLQKLSIAFWSIVGGIILLALGFVLWILKKRPASEEEEGWKRPSNRRKAPPRSASAAVGSSSAAAKATGAQSRPSFTVTEKTREEISEIISNVRSLPSSAEKDEQKMSDEQMKALEESGVLSALAQTLISEVSTEQTKEGAMSKLTIDASMVFDENDLPPDLKEWREEHGDAGIEDYLERLQQSEIKKGEPEKS